MKRRRFGLLSATSVAALRLGMGGASAAVDPSLLSTTLTPVGAERAGNADGSIPAWTGGCTEVPTGWQPGQYMPDLFAEDKPVVVINAANMTQYQSKLSDGVMGMMTKFGFNIQVYPTHRSAAAPQWVYDNIAKNATSAQLDPAGPRLGFSGGYGGIPFPIPDASDPFAGGAQVIWNHICRWAGYAYKVTNCGYVMIQGQPSLSFEAQVSYDFPYYRNPGTIASYAGVEYRQYDIQVAPPNILGQEIIAWDMSDPYVKPNETWELLNGQGRVRKAPEISFDTPSSQNAGLIQYDEFYGFYGSLEKYDWKLLGKKEIYIPYNNNGLYQHTIEAAHLAHFLNPDFVRWELHRVWVVEATVHPGERNVLARRRFYVDEDTWIICLSDAYDANNTLYHVQLSYNNVRPDLPGTVGANSTVTNLQTDNLASISGPWNEKLHPSVAFYDKLPNSLFDPANMAASAQY